MKDEIIVYCKDEEDIKQTYDYIIKTNEFKPIYMNKDRGEFVNNKNNKRIRCFTSNQNLRGLKAFVGLITKNMEEYLKSNEDLFWNIISLSIGDFCGKGINHSRRLIAPLSMLDKIIRNDITYILINDYRNSYDIEYMTTDIVSALGYLEDNQRCTIHICKQDDSLCERATLKIDEEWNYETIVEIISKLEIEK